MIAIFASWSVLLPTNASKKSNKTYRSVYSMVQKHIRHLKGISPEVDELAAEAIEDYGENDPLIRPNSLDNTV